MAPSKEETTQVKCHGEDKHHDGSQFGEGCLAQLAPGRTPHGCACWLFPASGCPPPPRQTPESQWGFLFLPGWSEYGLAVAINHRKCWWCDFYHLVCSMMLIHPIISSYINTVQSITHTRSASARLGRVAGTQRIISLKASHAPTTWALLLSGPQGIRATATTLGIEPRGPPGPAPTPAAHGGSPGLGEVFTSPCLLQRPLPLFWLRARQIIKFSLNRAGAAV